MKKVISFAMSMMLGASLLYGCTSGTASTSLQSEETASFFLFSQRFNGRGKLHDRNVRSLHEQSLLHLY